MKFAATYFLLFLVLPFCHAMEGDPCDTEGEFFHNTQDCNKYFWCVNERLIEMNCPALLKFSLTHENCVWPKDSDCIEDSDTSIIEETCLEQPSAIIAHPKECQLFYNCSIFYDYAPRVFEQHMDECIYPAVFDAESLQCGNFEDVDCGKREVKLDACSYRRNQCPVAHCIPCSTGSCEGKCDGVNANNRRRWTPHYTKCYKERAIESLYCPSDEDGHTQIFHPLINMCRPIYLIPKEHGGDMPYCNDKLNGIYKYNCSQYFVCDRAAISETVICLEGKMFDEVRRECWTREEACGTCGDVSLEDCPVTAN